ncbi:MAG: hypothetical protein KDA62_04695, partial [Planctomycetales bacterium]|nr:hypothetical protein [Planctomycetales bacterium]
PDTTLLYVEITEPEAIVDSLLNHALRAPLEALPQIQKARESKPFFQFRAGVALVEAKLLRTWRELVQSTDSISLAVDRATGGAVLMIRYDDEQTATQIAETIASLAKLDASGKGRPNPVKSAKHREITMYSTNEAHFAGHGPWLVVANNERLPREVLDRILNDESSKLIESDGFLAARKSVPADAVAWAYLDLATVRSGPDGEKLAAGRAENPLAELIAGGVLDNLTRAPYAAASLEFNTHRARLQFTLPHDAGQVAESRQYYFGPSGAGQAPPLLAAEGRILAISMYRQFSEMWLRAGDLYDDNVNDEIAKAESNLTTLFSGKDFGEDILGAFGPESQLIVARQSFADDQPRPAIQLPAFALAFRLNDPATMQPELRRTFQSLVGFLNIVGVMNGQPQLDLDMEKTEATQIVSASYLPPTDTDNPLPGGGAKINYNFSPTVAFSGDRFVLASTTGLARELIASSNRPAKPTADTDSKATDAAPSDTATINTAAQLNFAELLAILEANREQLIAQNMLSDGNSREEASAQIDALFTLLSRGRQATLRLDQPAGALRLSLDLQFFYEN